jgi:hypothetical protein
MLPPALDQLVVRHEVVGVREVGILRFGWEVIPFRVVVVVAVQQVGRFGVVGEGRDIAVVVRRTGFVGGDGGNPRIIVGPIGPRIAGVGGGGLDGARVAGNDGH